MTHNCVADEQLGQLARRTGEVVRRVSEGTISFDVAMGSMQEIIEGNPKPEEVMVKCEAFNGSRCTICGSYFDEGDICNLGHMLGCTYTHMRRP